MKLDLLQMTRDEKLRAMHELWADLTRDESAFESPDWHGAVLRETSERVEDGHERSHDWTEAKEAMRRRMT